MITGCGLNHDGSNACQMEKVVSFIYAIIISLICLIFKREILPIKTYSIIISANSYNPVVMFSSLICSLIITIMAIRVFYYGLYKYVGLNKGFCLFFCGIVALVAILTNVTGVIGYVS
ncbi:hypothetical protein ERICI_01032 [Paenibacillus larvae subsp. larvae]|nr:hypothetical protein ERICI_01032 [Paenibacillus larvae subsp. larvae]ETK28090.1 hypothetical protein ERIC1_1c15480 [Paenibacillus larvae subsp. larvae DSM 25719]